MDLMVMPPTATDPMATTTMITTMVQATMAEALDVWAGKPTPPLFHTQVPFFLTKLQRLPDFVLMDYFLLMR